MVIVASTAGLGAVDIVVWAWAARLPASSNAHALLKAPVNALVRLRNAGDE